ncbi:EAL domain-containing protein [Colwellia sp. MB02u-6]|uniref:EAL domain-containing protein n=1 Tax=Colwellia sp. MB02u-6 TaxID=2759824 RepID=UPI0015F6EE9A|nr:EAL domain-containing protein [Colwellia sp. MB02u-6]MBA6328533.1 EAL domain-containing protein [Colwellia sp. MB02u-6]
MDKPQLITFDSCVWGKVIIQPRTELIMTTLEHCNHAEWLCSITSQANNIPADVFFRYLTEAEQLKLFKVILTNLMSDPKYRSYTISLNTPIQVIKNFDECLPILDNNKEQYVAIEILEHDIQQLGHLELVMLDKINKRPNVSLWLDDFGKNQSNFDILLSKKIAFSTIKVSKELFWGLMASDVLFLKSLLIFLSKNHQVVVEGVESEEQASFLSQFSQIKMQGYLFPTIKHFAYE